MCKIYLWLIKEKKKRFSNFTCRIMGRCVRPETKPLNNISSFGCKHSSKGKFLLEATRWNQSWLKTTIICFDQVDAALAPGYPDDPLVEGFRVTLKRSDIATLGNLNWLNDEVCFEIKWNKSSYLTFHVTICRKPRVSGIILYLFKWTIITVL